VAKSGTVPMPDTQTEHVLGGHAVQRKPASRSSPESGWLRWG